MCGLSFCIRVEVSLKYLHYLFFICRSKRKHYIFIDIDAYIKIIFLAYKVFKIVS